MRERTTHQIEAIYPGQALAPPFDCEESVQKLAVVPTPLASINKDDGPVPHPADTDLSPLLR